MRAHPKAKKKKHLPFLHEYDMIPLIQTYFYFKKFNTW